MSPSVLGLPSRSTESVSVVSVSPPTYVRTYGLTKNLQDLGDSLTFLNAHAHTADVSGVEVVCPTHGDTPEPGTGCAVCRALTRAKESA